MELSPRIRTRKRISLQEVKLKQVKDGEGRPLRGLWESDIVRMEANEGGWLCEVPMREVGSEIGTHTGVYEFRSIERGGRWIRVGTYRTRDGGCIVAERLKSGIYVWRAGYTCEDGPVPSAVVEWAEVAEQVAKRTAL